MKYRANHIETINVGNQLGECVLWRDSDQSVWWTDVDEKRLYRLAWPSLALSMFTTPLRLCSFAFIEGTDRYILAAFETGLALFDPERGSVTWLSRPLELGDGVRLNDGRTDPGGRFWVGAMVEDHRLPKGSARLYRTDDTGGLETTRDGIQISNGLCWSPDGRTMYFCDSATRQILRSHYDPKTGRADGWTPFVRLDTGEPDGAVTDANGTYWSAHWGGARVAGFDANGSLVGEIEIPTQQPTCPALGGPNENLLFVTSAARGLDTAPGSAGNLFVFQTDLKAAPTGHQRVSSSILAAV